MDIHQIVNGLINIGSGLAVIPTIMRECSADVDDIAKVVHTVE